MGTGAKIDKAVVRDGALRLAHNSHDEMSCEGEDTVDVQSENQHDMTDLRLWYAPSLLRTGNEGRSMALCIAVSREDAAAKIRRHIDDHGFRGNYVPRQRQLDLISLGAIQEIAEGVFAIDGLR
jgi:hypothetical protein